MRKDRWEQSKKTSIAEAIREYEEQPTPEMALKFHERLLAYSMYDEAEKFRAEILYQHPDSTILPLGLAGQLDAMDRRTLAFPLYERVLQLDPLQLDARVGVAQLRMTQGRLEEARDLLDFLQRPGAAQDHALWPLEQLALAYQRAGQHERALELLTHLLAEIPGYENERSFRNMVRASEKAVGVRESLLSGSKFSLLAFLNPRNPRYAGWTRAAVMGGVLAAIVAGSLALANHHIRNHRKLLVFNGLSAPIQVAIDDQPPVEITEYRELVVAEGHHRVRLTGAVDSETQIDVRAGYWDRFFKKPVWVLNPGGAKVFVFRTIHYSVTPTYPDQQWLFGESFIHYPHVDYAFRSAPENLQIPSETSVVKKTQIEHFEHSPDQLFYLAIATQPHERALRFAEGRLERWPPDPALVELYSTFVANHQLHHRGRTFLEKSLWREPLSIPWHRSFRRFLVDRPSLEQLSADYDARLMEQPDDPTLLYLRGYSSFKLSEAKMYFERAHEADPALPWPILSLAEVEAMRGNWQAALQWLEHGLALGGNDRSFQYLRHLASMATGNTDELAMEYGRVLLLQPSLDIIVEVLRLSELQALKGEQESSRRTLEEFLAKSARTNQGSRDWRVYHALVQYMTGEFDEIPQTIESNVDPDLFTQALLLTKPPAEVVSHPDLAIVFHNGFQCISAALAFQLVDQQDVAAEWLQKASECFELEVELEPAGDLLRRSAPPTIAELDDLRMDPQWKAVYVCGLAARFPDKQPELCELARRLSVGRTPPTPLVHRFTEKVLGPKD